LCHVVFADLQQRVYLRFAAGIGPDDGWADRPVGCIQADTTVHLSAEADGGDGLCVDTCFRNGCTYRSSGSIPPVCRVLFGVAGLRLMYRVFLSGTGEG